MVWTVGARECAGRWWAGTARSRSRARLEDGPAHRHRRGWRAVHEIDASTRTLRCSRRRCSCPRRGGWCQLL